MQQREVPGIHQVEWSRISQKHTPQPSSPNHQTKHCGRFSINCCFGDFDDSINCKFYQLSRIKKKPLLHLRGMSCLCDFHLGASVLVQLHVHGYIWLVLGGIIYWLLLPKEPPSFSWLLDLGRWSIKVADPIADCPVITLRSFPGGWVVAFTCMCPSPRIKGGRSSSGEDGNCPSIAGYMGNTHIIARAVRFGGYF